MSEQTPSDPIMMVGIHKGKKISTIPVDYLKTIIVYHWMKPPHVEQAFVDSVNAFIKSKDPNWEYQRADSPHAQLIRARKIKEDAKQAERKRKEKGKKGKGETTPPPAVPKEVYEIDTETSS